MISAVLVVLRLGWRLAIIVGYASLFAIVLGGCSNSSVFDVSSGPEDVYADAGCDVLECASGQMEAGPSSCLCHCPCIELSDDRPVIGVEATLPLTEAGVERYDRLWQKVCAPDSFFGNPDCSGETPDGG